ncbi:hypothetical protein PSPO01_12530 [Paraphaeosphaeria sporulosa]
MCALVDYTITHGAADGAPRRRYRVACRATATDSRLQLQDEGCVASASALDGLWRDWPAGYVGGRLETAALPHGRGRIRRGRLGRIDGQRLAGSLDACDGVRTLALRHGKSYDRPRRRGKAARGAPATRRDEVHRSARDGRPSMMAAAGASLPRGYGQWTLQAGLGWAGGVCSPINAPSAACIRRLRAYFLCPSLLSFCAVAPTVPLPPGAPPPACVHPVAPRRAVPSQLPATLARHPPHPSHLGPAPRPVIPGLHCCRRNLACISQQPASSYLPPRPRRAVVPTSLTAPRPSYSTSTTTAYPPPSSTVTPLRHCNFMCNVLTPTLYPHLRR